MTAGDISVELVENATTTSVETAVTNLYVGDSDTWQIFSMNNGQDVMIVHIEGA
jgi:hypothetical protein